MHLWSERSVVLQVFIEGDLLKFVNGNVLMDIDVPAMLVVLLPLDALSYEEATFLFSATPTRSTSACPVLDTGTARFMPKALHVILSH